MDHERPDALSSTRTVAARPRVAIVTSMPRSERLHVYNEMARMNEVDFRVFYLRQMAYGRSWDVSELPEIRHDAVMIPERRIHKHVYLSPGFLRAYRSYRADFMLMTQYYAPAMQATMWLETIRRRPWVFWSEPPFTRFSEAPILPVPWLNHSAREIGMLPLKYAATEVWATGERAVEEYRSVIKDRVPVRNLPYYADLDRFLEIPLDRPRAPIVRFLFCGTLTRRKAADAVAMAAAKLAQNRLDFRLIVVGEGPLADDFEQLPHDARSKIEIKGFQRLKEIPAAFAATDVLVFPSRHDGFGMTLLEGMASGHPVISTEQTGSAVETIEDGVNGFLLKSSSPELIYEKMRYFIEHPAQILEMGKRARQVSTRFTHRVGARKFTDRLLEFHSRYCTQ